MTFLNASIWIVPGIAFIALFAIVGVMVGPDDEGMNSPALGNSKDTNQG